MENIASSAALVGALMPFAFDRELALEHST
jgi:hypothetical protein